MKLTWHIFLKDLRQVRGLVALWVALIMVGFVILALVSSVAWPFSAPRFSALIIVLLYVHVFVGVLLTAAIIQGDPLAGTRSFWTTRPISKGRLLGAKLLGLTGVICLMPVLAGLPWWLAFGFGPEGLMHAAQQTLQVSLIAVLFALPLAVLTEDADRFVRWALTIGIGLIVLLVLLNARGGLGPVDSVSVGLWRTRMFLREWGLIAAVAGVVLHQFLTRRTGRSTAWTVASAGVILAAYLWWPYDLSSWWPPKEPPHRVAAEAEAIDIRWREGKWQPAVGAILRGQAADEFVLVGDLRGVPAGCGVVVERVTLSTSDGRELPTTTMPARTAWLYPDGRRENLTEYYDINARRFWLQKTIGGVLGLAATDGPAPALEIALRLTGGAKKPVSGPAVRADVRFALVRCAVDAELPLRSGARAAGRDFAVNISACEMDRGDGRALVSWVERRPAEGGRARRDAIGSYRWIKPIDNYCLIDRRHQMLLNTQGGLANESMLNGVCLWQFEMVQSVAEGAQGDKGDGIENMRLVKVAYENVGTFNRTFNDPSSP
jgi:hypothetical protein